MEPNYGSLINDSLLLGATRYRNGKPSKIQNGGLSERLKKSLGAH
jgi:hypothetical protein